MKHFNFLTNNGMHQGVLPNHGMRITIRQYMLHIVFHQDRG